MQFRLILVALVAFALGAVCGRFAKLTAHDRVVSAMQATIDTQRKLIDESEQEQKEIYTALGIKSDEQTVVSFLE